MTPPDTRASAPLRARLALDPRALALLRAGLALLLALDAALRLCAAGALYSDQGLLPRAIAVELQGPLQWSLHLANGSGAFAVAMAALQLLAALALTVGWRSRIAGTLLWVLLVSAFVRHPAVVGASGLLALSLLSLGVLLPWNARWSVDRALASDRNEAEDADAPAGAAALALRVHVALLPAWLALATLDATGGLAGLLASEHGNALGHALGSRLPGAIGLLEVVLRGAAFLVVPLALWPAVWAGRVAAASYAALALLALALVHAGALPWLGLLGAGLLADRGLWDRLAARAAPGDLRVHFDRDAAGAEGLARLLRTFLCLSHAQVAPAQDHARSARLLGSGRRLVVIDHDDQAHLDAAAVAVLLRRSPLLGVLRPLLGAGVGSALGSAVLAWCRPGARLHRVGIDPVSGGRSRVARLAAPVLAGLLAISHAVAAGVLPAALGRATATALQPVGLDRTWLDALPTVDGARRWLTVVGERLDGGEADATDPALPRADYARRTLPWFAAPHARAYEAALARPGANDASRRALAHRACSEHADSLARVRVTLMVRQPGTTVAEQQVLLRHECRPDDAP